jgi:hypothetical protein
VTETATIHEVGRTILDLAIQNDSWDEMPTIIYIGRGSDGGVKGLLAVIADQHPSDYLEAMTRLVRSGGKVEEFSDSYPLGIAILWEGWGLVGATPADEEYLRNGGLIRDLADRRIETKLLFAWDGERATAAHHDRNDQDVTEEDDASHLGGRISESVTNFFAALIEASRT